MTTPPSSQQEVTRLLADWSGGDHSALERLIPLVQPELHRLAHHYMSREAIGHTLQTTALLNEAYLHLVDDPKRNWQNRTHFVAAAAQLMRRIDVTPVQLATAGAKSASFGVTDKTPAGRR